MNTDKYSTLLLVLWRQKTWNNGYNQIRRKILYCEEVPNILRKLWQTNVISLQAWRKENEEKLGGGINPLYEEKQASSATFMNPTFHK